MKKNSAFSFEQKIRRIENLLLGVMSIMLVLTAVFITIAIVFENPFYIVLAAVSFFLLVASALIIEKIDKITFSEKNKKNSKIFLTKER